MHAPQSIQESGSTDALPSTMLIALLGHSSTQDSHPVHFALSTSAGIYNPFKTENHESLQKVRNDNESSRNYNPKLREICPTPPSIAALCALRDKRFALMAPDTTARTAFDPTGSPYRRSPCPLEKQEGLARSQRSNRKLPSGVTGATGLTLGRSERRTVAILRTNSWLSSRATQSRTLSKSPLAAVASR